MSHQKARTLILELRKSRLNSQISPERETLQQVQLRNNERMLSAERHCITSDILICFPEALWQK